MLLKVIYFNGERCGDKEEHCNLSEAVELSISEGRTSEAWLLRDLRAHHSPVAIERHQSKFDLSQHKKCYSFGNKIELLCRRRFYVTSIILVI